MSYTPIYRQAFEAFDGEPVRDFLLGQIGNPDFEVEAAFALRRREHHRSGSYMVAKRPWNQI
jgi:hypothetical protein